MSATRSLTTDDAIVVPGDWYAFDFHVHSPASRDFAGPYKGKTTEEDTAYLWLLEQANLARLNVLAITDHNDIKGYMRLQELRTELESTAKTLSRSGHSIPEEVQHQIDLFANTIILSGVELDTDPNIHMLVIFDPRTSLSQMNEFLSQAGFPEDHRGDETAARHANWNPLDACAEASKLNAIVIAAHVDSDKGLYEASKKWGQKRIAAFIHEGLYAMEFINPIARDQIENILKLTDYKRETRLAFVQSSDFHGMTDQKFGERVTWVRLDNIRFSPVEVFNSLKDALRNPDEYISAPGRPEIKEIQHRLSDKPAINGFADETDTQRLLRYVSAFANSNGGTLVIGRNEKGNWRGFEGNGNDEIHRAIVSTIQKGVRPIPKHDVQVYPFYENKFFATVRIQKHSQICTTVEDQVYFWESDKVNKATISQVIQLAEDRLLQRYSDLSISSYLRDISKRLGGLRDSIDILPIVRKIETQTTTFAQVFADFKSGTLLTPAIRDCIDFEFNGCFDGQCVVLDLVPPRTDEHYIRFTAPLGKCDLSSPALNDIPRFTGDKLIIAPGGAVYFDQNDVIVCSRAWESLIFRPESNKGSFSLKFIAAYLKSAIPIWYADRCLGSPDIREIDRLARIPIPQNVPAVYEQRITVLADQLLAMEKDFLIREQAALANDPIGDNRPTQEWLEARGEASDQHNRAAEDLMSKIEQLFFEMFGMTSEEIESIQIGMKSSGFAIFKG